MDDRIDSFMVSDESRERAEQNGQNGTAVGVANIPPGLAPLWSLHNRTKRDSRSIWTISPLVVERIALFKLTISLHPAFVFTAAVFARGNINHFCIRHESSILFVVLPRNSSLSSAPVEFVRNTPVEFHVTSGGVE